MSDVVPLFPDVHSVVIYTRGNCSRCEKAKAYLKTHKIAYEERDIDGRDPETQAQYRALLLSKYPSIKMLPVVELNGVVIGSSDELIEFYDKERLSE